MPYIQTNDEGRVLAASVDYHVNEENEIEVEALPETFFEVGSRGWLYVDGEFVRDDEPEAPEVRIMRLKGYLAETDYVAAKAMDALMRSSSQETQKAALTSLYSEYQDVLEQRQEWRDEINELESEIGGGEVDSASDM